MKEFEERKIRSGKAIRAARVAAGMTREELAGAIAVSADAVKKWETGKNLPPIDRIADVARATGGSAFAAFGCDGETARESRQPFWLTEAEEETFRMIRNLRPDYPLEKFWLEIALPSRDEAVEVDDGKRRTVARALAEGEEAAAALGVDPYEDETLMAKVVATRAEPRAIDLEREDGETIVRIDGKEVVRIVPDESESYLFDWLDRTFWDHDGAFEYASLCQYETTMALARSGEPPLDMFESKRLTMAASETVGWIIPLTVAATCRADGEWIVVTADGVRDGRRATEKTILRVDDGDPAAAAVKAIDQARRFVETEFVTGEEDAIDSFFVTEMAIAVADVASRRRSA